jgi:hypothetical protein
MNNIGKIWTSQEELELLDELSDKKPLNEIAKSHGRSFKAIQMRIEYMIRKHYNEQKYPLSHLCSLYNKDEDEIKTILNNDTSKEYKSAPNQNFSSSKKTSESKLDEIQKKLETIEKLLTKLLKKMK